MSEIPQPPDDDDLQFEVVEAAQSTPASAPSTACAICQAPISSTYYSLRDKLICPSCREQLGRQRSSGGLRRFVLACLFGLGAGLLGTVLWYVIRVVTNMELGIVAMLVGYMVGKAVRKGSGGWGGLGYQVMAVLITYVCIAGTYLPEMLQAVRQQANAHHAKLTARNTLKGDTLKGDTLKGDTLKGDTLKGDTLKGDTLKGDTLKGDTLKGDTLKGDTLKGDTAKGDTAKGDTAKKDAVKEDATKTDKSSPDEKQDDAEPDAPDQPKHAEPSAMSFAMALAILIGICLSLPVLVGTQNPIMLIIFGIGLWEAWKFTGRLVLPIQGPFELGPRTT